MTLIEMIRAVREVRELSTKLESLRPVLDELTELLPKEPPKSHHKKIGRPKGSKNRPKGQFDDLSERAQVAASG